MNEQNSGKNISKQEYDAIRFDWNREMSESIIEEESASPRGNELAATRPKPSLTSDALSSYLLNIVANTSKSKEFKTYLDYLLRLNEPDVILNDEKSIEALVTLNILVNEDPEYIKMALETDFCCLLRDLVGHLYESLAKDLSRGKLNRKVENKNIAKFFVVVELVESLVCYSKNFCTLFYLNSGAEYLLFFFQNQSLLKFFLTKSQKSDSSVNRSKLVYMDSLSIAVNIFLMFKVQFKSFLDLNLVRTVLDFVDLLSSDKMELIFKCFLLVSDLCSDQQIVKYNQIGKVRDLLCIAVGCFAEACAKSVKYSKFVFPYRDRNNTSRSFKLVIKFPVTILLLNVVYALLKVSTSIKISFRIFQSIRNSLIILLIQGNVDEKLAALTMLYYYSFNPTINEMLSGNQSIKSTLDQIKQENDSTCSNLAILLSQLLSIDQTVDEFNRQRASCVSYTNELNVVVCCSVYDELVCMLLKQELNRRGGIQASLLKRITESKEMMDELAQVKKSIEACDIFVICVNFDFNENLFAMFELFYAQKLQKRIVPFIYEDYVLDNTCVYLRQAYQLDKRAFRVKESDIEKCIAKFVQDKFSCESEPRSGFLSCFR